MEKMVNEEGRESGGDLYAQRRGMKTRKNE
jgi:hypothetical protein